MAADAKRLLSRFIVRIAPVLDIVFFPIVLVGGILFAAMRRIGIQHFRIGRKTLYFIGVFPIVDHYYEPLFNPRHLYSDLNRDRMLPGIDLNESGQLAFLENLEYGSELAGPAFESLVENGLFESGDAEYWYNVVRFIKPARIIEIGSGYSTLVTVQAVSRNREENPEYECRHICIEPYEMPWLENAGPEIVRSRAELAPATLFSQMGKNDILFIDSSHVIRPQGDVVFEFLELLPKLGSQVIVHVHDIFTPRDYPDRLIKQEVRLWNEQYLLEAFLTHNNQWRVLGALNFLKHHHYDQLLRVSPYLTKDREPGSFYLQKL
jgi:hypothetical protein